MPINRGHLSLHHHHSVRAKLDMPDPDSVALKARSGVTSMRLALTQDMFNEISSLIKPIAEATARSIAIPDQHIKTHVPLIRSAEFEAATVTNIVVTKFDLGDQGVALEICEGYISAAAHGVQAVIGMDVGSVMSAPVRVDIAVALDVVGKLRFGLEGRHCTTDVYAATEIKTTLSSFDAKSGAPTHSFTADAVAALLDIVEHAMRPVLEEHTSEALSAALKRSLDSVLIRNWDVAGTVSSVAYKFQVDFLAAPVISVDDGVVYDVGVDAFYRTGEPYVLESVAREASKISTYGRCLQISEPSFDLHAKALCDYGNDARVRGRLFQRMAKKKKGGASQQPAQPAPQQDQPQQPVVTFRSGGSSHAAPAASQPHSGMHSHDGVSFHGAHGGGGGGGGPDPTQLSQQQLLMLMRAMQQQQIQQQHGHGTHSHDDPAPRSPPGQHSHDGINFHDAHGDSFGGEHDDPNDVPGTWDDRALPYTVDEGRDWKSKGFTIGIAGPVGSGKTTLVQLICEALREQHSMCVLVNEPYTTLDAQRLIAANALPRERIKGITTGMWGRIVINEDIEDNFRVLEAVSQRFSCSILVLEASGDNLAANFDRNLSDFSIFLLDAASGESSPLKGGKGITQSDLLVINKTDLAPLCKVDLQKMEENARKMRASSDETTGGDVLLAQTMNNVGVDEIIAKILAAYNKAGVAEAL
ncbi:hypothetical protein HDU82_005673 [Entophlyctis luteolus]|nr:hypothetical protein HDU82_005673 [Entophlyctis luteolus]